MTYTHTHTHPHTHTHWHTHIRTRTHTHTHTDTHTHAHTHTHARTHTHTHTHTHIHAQRDYRPVKFSALGGKKIVLFVTKPLFIPPPPLLLNWSDHFFWAGDAIRKILLFSLMFFCNKFTLQIRPVFGGAWGCKRTSPYIRK